MKTVPEYVRVAVEESLKPLIANWIKAHPNATEKQREDRYEEVSNPAKNKRGEVYCDHWHTEARRLLGLK